MYAKLYGKSGVFRGKSFVVSGETRIGRKSDNEITLPAGTISSYHARIFPDEDGGSFLIEDLGSLNGTCVDGVPVRGAEKLGSLHVITFAENADFIFRALQGSAPEEDSEAGVAQELSKHGTAVEVEVPVWVEPPVLEDSSEREKQETNVELDLGPVPSFEGEGEAASPPELVVRYAGRSAQLQVGENLVGRVEDAAIRIDDPSVSRRHALLLWDAVSLRVRDLGSSNGTFVGGKELSGEQALDLPAEVRFGSCDVRIEVSRDD